MAYTVTNAAQYAGKTVRNGHCVALLQEAGGVPHTSTWRQGHSVRGHFVPAGTAIATFENGRYTNRTDGSAHAAILIAKQDDGILVWDCWQGQPVHQRVIRYQGGRVQPVNDGDAFYVIEPPPERVAREA
jgi:hypothetical protein